MYFSFGLVVPFNVASECFSQFKLRSAQSSETELMAKEAFNIMWYKKYEIAKSSNGETELTSLAIFNYVSPYSKL